MQIDIFHAPDVLENSFASKLIVHEIKLNSANVCVYSYFRYVEIALKLFKQKLNRKIIINNAEVLCKEINPILYPILISPTIIESDLNKLSFLA